MGQISPLCLTYTQQQMVRCSQYTNLCQFANFIRVGIVSGTVGAAGNFGGIIFSIIFRYNGTHYDRSIWIIGVICIVVNMSVFWIRPVPTLHK